MEKETHTSLRLENDARKRNSIDSFDANPKPFVWTMYFVYPSRSAFSIADTTESGTSVGSPPERTSSRHPLDEPSSMADKIEELEGCKE